jgi:hypothetical protein
LRETGFEETTSLAGLKGPEGEGQIGLFARKSWRDPAAASPSPEKSVDGLAEKSWLIFTDNESPPG